ncbi:UNVERIFIED_CONTAM: hypothetical protein Sangu_2223500 [Sesamum angustifolium]|uniref:Reverse transcriptase n=1 Tax=Sesamum angustifolium TaxID=2727405 RepID=A0AAW2L6N1_9LAMI
MFKLQQEDTRHLSMKPTIEEVKCAVFDISPDSAAGPDGFSAHFFQVCWDIIGEDLFEAVLDFFTGAQPPKTFTTTTIVLIPKLRPYHMEGFSAHQSLQCNGEDTVQSCQ